MGEEGGLSMYEYRKLTREQREELIRWRREKGFPLHAPPHLEGFRGEYLITAACYEHRPIFEDPKMLTELTFSVLEALKNSAFSCSAWVFLPNHYHLLITAHDLREWSEFLRRLHSRIAAKVNREQKQPGRRVWYRYSDRFIRGERHHWASVNYLHFNPVKHGYVDRIEDWPWSSWNAYEQMYGAKYMEEVFRSYPLNRYGDKWDP